MKVAVLEVEVPPLELQRVEHFEGGRAVVDGENVEDREICLEQRERVLLVVVVDPLPRPGRSPSLVPLTN